MRFDHQLNLLATYFDEDAEDQTFIHQIISLDSGDLIIGGEYIADGYSTKIASTLYYNKRQDQIVPFKSHVSSSNFRDVPQLRGVASALDTDFSISPNPASGEISITSDITPDRVEIYSMDGKLLITRFNKFSSISTKKLKDGIYLAVVHFGTRVRSNKFIVTHE